MSRNSKKKRDARKKKQRSRPPGGPASRPGARGFSPQDEGTLTLSLKTHQDSVLPVKLNFPPPLADLGTDPSTFDYQWQHLTYAFNLPDPAAFPPIPGELPAQDVRRLKRFVEVCEKTAGYTVVAHKGGISFHSDGPGSWSLEVNEADDDQIVGFSVRFRQLHSSSAGDPDFSVVINLLNKYARQFTDEQTPQRLEILEQWKKARAQLVNRPLQNIVCRMVLEKSGCPDIEAHEMYGDVDPTKIFNLFNYGELIHFGKHSDEYDQMAAEPDMEDIQNNNFMIAMLGLVHLYFGFSAVIRSAIGAPRKVA